MSEVAPALPPPQWRAADPASLRDAVERAGGGGEPPAPGLTEYAFDLGRWLQSQLAALLGRALPDAGFEALELIVTYAAVLVAIAALAVVGVLVARRVRRTRREGAAPGASEAAVPVPPPATAREAEWWWAEAARRLERGEVRAALGALWWWAARRLDPPGLDESWTTGELLRGRGRGAAALRPPLRRLDALLWGAEPPRAEQVEELRGELRRRVEAE